MAYFAQVTNDIVTEVIEISDDICSEEYPASQVKGQAFIANDLHLTGLFLQTFYDVPGKTYAGIGYTWNGTDFVEPPPPPIPTPIKLP